MNKKMNAADLPAPEAMTLSDLGRELYICSSPENTIVYRVHFTRKSVNLEQVSILLFLCCFCFLIKYVLSGICEK